MPWIISIFGWYASQWLPSCRVSLKIVSQRKKYCGKDFTNVVNYRVNFWRLPTCSQKTHWSSIEHHWASQRISLYKITPQAFAVRFVCAESSWGFTGRLSNTELGWASCFFSGMWFFRYQRCFGENVMNKCKLIPSSIFPSTSSVNASSHTASPYAISAWAISKDIWTKVVSLGQFLRYFWDIPKMVSK